jgi:hypothetical protein
MEEADFIVGEKKKQDKNKYEIEEKENKEKKK